MSTILGAEPWAWLLLIASLLVGGIIGYKSDAIASKIRKWRGRWRWTVKKELAVVVVLVTAAVVIAAFRPRAQSNWLKVKQLMVEKELEGWRDLWRKGITQYSVGGGWKTVWGGWGYPILVHVKPKVYDVWKQIRYWEVRVAEYTQLMNALRGLEAWPYFW